MPGPGVDRDGPDRVDLVPAVLAVIDPGPDQPDPVTDAGHRQVAVVAGHELDHQQAVLLAVVAAAQQALVLDRDIEVQIAVLLAFADQGDLAGDPPARIQYIEAFGVVEPPLDL